MCNSPNKLADGSLVACRKCGQCRSNRIDEWVGRCIAESKTAIATTSITLTYGRDEEGNESHERAAILTYSDVQKYFKQLKNRGYPCRYLITGEMGSKKGRTHWHGIVFWTKAIPKTMTDYGGNSWHRAKRDIPVEVPIVFDQRFNEPCWVHGFSFWQPVSYGYEQGSIAYACKYIQKDLDDPTAQSKLVMSKLPPIGSEYFIQRAQKFVDAGISPQDPYYQFPMQARRKNGNVINFMLRGKLKEIFCEAFIDKWCEQVGGHWPHSDFLDEYQDRLTRKESGDYEYIGAGRWERHPQKVFETEEKASCRSVIPASVASALRKQYKEPEPQLTPLGWLYALERMGVVWMSSPLVGRYSQAKIQPATGRRVWLRSLVWQKRQLWTL